MTREQYDQLSAPLVRTLLDMEDDILREIAAQLAKGGKVSDTSKWRIRQLARSGRFDKRAAAIIDGYSGVQNGQALDMILEAAQTEIGYLDNAVQAANAAGLSEYFSDIPAEASALNAAKAFQKQAASDLNLVNTVMKYKAGSAFVSAVNSVYRESQKSRQDVLDVMGKSSAKVVMGHMSLQEATRKTIRELARKGIPAFVDKAGREWSPEAYIMMDMRSTLANTARAAQDMRCDQYGIQLIEVSSHMGARPLCAPYQGRIFSRDGSKGITMDGAGGKIYYTPLSETSYGQPAGLFGINCGHVQYPFAPGINFQRYFPYPEEENAERYKQFQRQRAMERDIRATKRECMMLQETGDTEGLQKASQRLRAQKEKYSQYSRDCGLGTHYDRTQVYGYDRSKSAKTVWAERKANSPPNGLTSGGASGMIKSSVKDRIYEYEEGSKILYYSPEDVEKELLKSKIGRQINQAIMDNNYLIEFDYSEFQLLNDERTLGQVISRKKFCVFPNNCESIQEVAETIIHETTHLLLGTDVDTQKEEVYCKLQELLHTQDEVSISDVKRIISEVKSTKVYKHLKWRDENGL